jgi:predicted MFS family arabinose efflux permease
MAGLLCGLLVGRALAGLIGDHLGWRMLFWLAAGLLAVMGVVLQMTLPHRAPALKLSYARLMHSMSDLVKAHPTLRIASFVSATSFGAFVAFWTVLSFLMESRLGRGATEAGMLGIVGLVGAVAAPLAGRLSDKKGPAFTLTIAMLVTMLSFVQMWLWVSMAGLVVGVLLLDLGVQSAQVSAQSEVMNLDPGARSRLNTIYMVIRFIGGAAGSAIGAAAWSRGGWGATCAAALIALAVGTIVHLLGTRAMRKPSLAAA